MTCFSSLDHAHNSRLHSTRYIALHGTDSDMGTTDVLPGVIRSVDAANHMMSEGATAGEMIPRMPLSVVVESIARLPRSKPYSKSPIRQASYFSRLPSPEKVSSQEPYGLSSVIDSRKRIFPLRIIYQARFLRAKACPVDRRLLISPLPLQRRSAMLLFFFCYIGSIWNSSWVESTERRRALDNRISLVSEVLLKAAPTRS